jgi:hypothetical protein
MPPFAPTYLHARVLAGGAEIWRGASVSSRTTAGESFVDVYPEQVLQDGTYRVEVWSSAAEDPAEAAPSGALTGMSFIVDTEAPAAPAVTGGYGHATAVSTAPDLVALHFEVFGTTRKKAAPGQEVSYTSEISGPTPPVSVRAEDRAGNLGPSASTSV